MADIKELTLNYYAAVDAGDDDATADLFAADATYDRPGYDTLSGPAIREFYKGDRVIASGAHTVTEVLVDGNRAAAHGEFNGTLKDGSPAHEGFADFFEFADSGEITKRTTYFYRAAV